MTKNKRCKQKIEKLWFQDLKLWHINKKVYVPKAGRERMIEWYHSNLQHAGSERTATTMRQHFDWPGAKSEVYGHVSRCLTCQKCKITGVKQYGKIPLPQKSEAEVAPWHTVHVDLIGPWAVRFNMMGKIITKDIEALTMVDKATTWPEIIMIKNKTSKHVSELFDNEWLCRYPRPARVIHDNGNEFIGNEFKEMLSSYGVKSCDTSVKNPRGNAIVERMHLTMGDMLRGMEFDGSDWKVELNRSLQSVAWAIRSTVSTALNHTPGQLVFGRDMIMQTRVVADWERIKQKKRMSTIRSNQRENRNRVHHNYKVGDKILIVLKVGGPPLPKMELPTEGPYTVIRVFRNERVRIKRGRYEENIHVRRIKPFRT